MKRSKKEETSIIIYFIFYTILFIILLIYTVISIYPKLITIEEKKNSIENTYKKINILNTKGLSFSEFKIESTKNGLNTYTSELIKNIIPIFYKDNFINTSDKDYVNFLSDKNDKMKDEDIKNDFEKKQEQIIKLLPTYSEVDLNDGEQVLTNFKFINYIEVILQTFGLNYSNEIGLNDVVLVKEYTDTKKKSKLDTNIYYIPLKLNIEGTKYNIINFLYFIEKVGNISISPEGKINIYNQADDRFLYRGNKKILLVDKLDLLQESKKKQLQEYNIYENQLFDIESLSFDGYLDKSENISEQQNIDGMYQRVRKSQGDDKISMSLSLRFYIKGVQNIKMIESINSYTNYYNTMNKILSKENNNKNLNQSVKNIVKKSQSVLKEVGKEGNKIKISINKQENLVETLVKTVELTNILHKINSQIGYNFYIINFINDFTVLENNKNLEKTNKILYQYINKIKVSVYGIKKSTKEISKAYINRINQKKIFQKAFEYQKNIYKLK